MSDAGKMIRAVFSQTMGRKEVNLLLEMLLNDTAQIEPVFRMIFDENEKIAWHAARIIEKVSGQDATLFSDEKKLRLINFAISNKHTGVQRLCLSILFNLPVYQPVPVEFINLCFEQMLSPHQSVGVQVLSMKLLHKICTVYPDFVPELIVCLENSENNLYTSGFIAAKRNTLKSLIYKNKQILFPKQKST